MSNPAAKTWPLIAPVLALLLLAAHFYRAAAWPLVVLTLALLPLMELRRPWVPVLLQLALWVGAAEWLWTAWMLMQQRLALGQPWQRMALILGVVSLLTAGAAFVFRAASVKLRYTR